MFWFILIPKSSLYFLKTEADPDVLQESSFPWPLLPPGVSLAIILLIPKCFTMCNTGNWVTVNKGVRRPLVRFWWTEGPRGVLWEGRFSAKGGRKSQSPPANRWSEWNRSMLMCFSAFKQLSLTLVFCVFLSAVSVCVCVCVSARAACTSTAQLERKWTSPSNERQQVVDVTLLAWKRSCAFASDHLRGSPSVGWPRVVSLLVSTAAGWKQFAVKTPPSNQDGDSMALWYSN